MMNAKRIHASIQHIIALEGIDGAGKSTITQRLKTQLQDDLIIYSRTKKTPFYNKILSIPFIKKHQNLQIPIYWLLSWHNYFEFVHRYSGERIVIMDRCFLSSMCYFFPKAISSKTACCIFKMLEVKLFPEKIFIIDVDPRIAQQRDGYKKQLKWLIQTRRIYRRCISNESVLKCRIEVLNGQHEINYNSKIILNEIRRMLK